MYNILLRSNFEILAGKLIERHPMNLRLQATADRKPAVVTLWDNAGFIASSFAPLP